MAIEVGAAYVTILPSAKGFSQKLRTELSRELRGAGDGPGHEFGKGFGDSAGKTAGEGIQDAVRSAGNGADTEGGKAGKRFGGGFSRSLKASLKTGFAAAAGDTDRLGEKIRSVNIQLGGMASGALKIGALSTVLGSLTSHASSLGRDLAPLVGLTAALPGAIGIAAAAVGTLKVATAGFGDALTAAGKGEKEFAEATKGMAPNMLSSVRAVRALNDEFAPTKRAVQQAFWAHMASSIREVGASSIPVLRRGMVGVSTEMGSFVRHLGSAVIALNEMGVTSTIFRSLARVIAGLTPATIPVVLGLGLIVAESSKIVAGFDGAGAAGTRFYVWAKRISSDGSLHAWFKAGASAASSLWDVFVGVGRILYEVGRAAASASGAVGLAGLAVVVDRVADSLGSPEVQAALVGTFSKMNAVLSTATSVFIAVLPHLVRAAPFILAAAAAWKVFATISLIVSGVQTAVTAAMWLFTPSVVTATGAVTGLSAIMGVLTSPITLVVLAIAALAAGLVYLYRTNQTVRTAVQAAWAGIKSAVSIAWNGFIRPALVAFAGYITGTVMPAISRLWNTVVRPVFAALGRFIATTWTGTVAPALRAFAGFMSGTVGPGVLRLWTEYVRPAFTGIGAFIQATWTNVIRPAFSFLATFVKYVLGPVIMFLWQGIVAPAFRNIGTIIQVAWNVVIKPVLWALKTFIQVVLAPVFGWLWRSVIKPAFTLIGAGIRLAWFGVIKPVFGALEQGMKRMPGVFEAATKAIQKVWNGLRAIGLKPVEFVVQSVLNQGLIKGVNALASNLGMKKKGENLIPYIPWTTKLAVGGRVPGWSPNDTADNIPAMLTADEFVTRRSSTRRMQKKHPGVLEYINEKGELPGAQHFARGGLAQPWPSAVALAAKRMFPGLRSVGGYGARSGPSDHGSGNALDFMVPDSSAVGDAIAQWGLQNRNALRLKYIIWKKQTIGGREGWDGWRPYTRYGNSRNRTLQHYDHPHFSFQHGRMGNPLVLAKGLSAAAFAALKAAAGAMGSAVGDLNPFGAPLDAAKQLMSSKMGSFGPMGALAGGIGGKLFDSIGPWLAEKAASIFGVGPAVDSATPSGSGGGAAGVRAAVQGAAAKRGWNTGPQWDALSWIINHESSWNPNAQNPRSTAYGLFQFLNGTWGSTGIGKTSDPGLQSEAGMRYLQSRYGTPAAAQAFWKRRGYYNEGGPVKPTLYDAGGMLSPGLTLVSNQTGKPETVRTHEQEKTVQRQLNGGGDTININAIKYDAVPEMVDALDYALQRRRGRGRYAGVGR